MNQYRKDIEKLYQRIIKIVSKGDGYLQNYIDLIDEMVEYGNSELLQDVMYTKFKIDTRTFANIDALKRNTFKKVASFLQSQSNQNLDTLFKSKGVFSMGTQFFDSMSSQYLGDIKQYNSQTVSQILDVYTFFPDLLKNGIPNYPTNPNNTLDYKKENVVYYNNQLFICVQNYTWSKNNRITPTFSNYWVQVYPGTQSYHTIADQSISIIERYSNSIDILRSYQFLDYSNNKYIERNYIDEYFE